MPVVAGPLKTTRLHTREKASKSAFFKEGREKGCSLPTSLTILASGHITLL